jgi:putative membrane protein
VYLLYSHSIHKIFHHLSQLFFYSKASPMGGRKKDVMVHGFHGGFGLGFLNLIGMVLFFGFIFMLIKGFAMRSSGRDFRGYGPWAHKRCGPQHVKQDDAMQTARDRFARGEMDQEQFETVKTGLAKEQPQEPTQSWKGWSQDSALELARMRFAKGEITLEEYETIKKGLQNG